ncbi:MULTISPECIES: helix-turn-helix transcriptional regulator [unclassified Mycolicibacterium]|uniref:helix-turn-helix domain-containing protein n=1 Tax=unclassified Mycolicibacterium TaxID=2636767 RepID=UPI00139177B6|nr:MULTISPECIES: helix-turn-helix transcriptional regulator [unclassified Mycolicibacterium]
MTNDAHDAPDFARLSKPQMRMLRNADRGADIDVQVGANVQRYRSALGLSQADLAAALSKGGELIHQQTIQKIEKGSRPLKYSEAIRICDVLGVSPRSLAEGDKETEVAAQFMQLDTALGHMKDQLLELAQRLAPLLVEQAVLIAEARDQSDQPRYYAFGMDRAFEWINYLWEQELADALWREVGQNELTVESGIAAKATYSETLQELAGGHVDYNRWFDEQYGQLEKKAVVDRAKA